MGVEAKGRAGRIAAEDAGRKRTDRARKPRADAQRNRDRLLKAAKAAFADAGADVSLDEIARRAGVGIGTFYRHFPSRNAIVEAVYQREVQQLAEAATRLIGSLPPGEALREWMRLFVDYIATKKVIAPVLKSMVGGASELYATSGARTAEGHVAIGGAHKRRRRDSRRRRSRRSRRSSARLLVRLFQYRSGQARVSLICNFIAAA